MGIWTPKGIMMYNISFIDFGVTDEPLEEDETWTKMMYICLFLGGFWCGAVTFVMLLAQGIVRVFKDWGLLRLACFAI